MGTPQRATYFIYTLHRRANLNKFTLPVGIARFGLELSKNIVQLVRETESVFQMVIVLLQQQLLLLPLLLQNLYY